jgi:endonuclease/exonuclease/phosphatase family metal-dependent hydrolase
MIQNIEMIVEFLPHISLGILSIYLLLFLPFVRHWFHKFRVYRYYAHSHPTRHLQNNSGRTSNPSAWTQWDARRVPLGTIRHVAYHRRPLVSAAPSTLRVVSWNIEFGYCLDELVTELALLDADVIALQEVDYFHGNFTVDCLGVLASRLRMCAVWAGHHAYRGSYHCGQWGCAVLSRFPLRDAQSLALTHLPGYPRSALGVLVESPYGTVCVYSVHLEVCCGLTVRLAQMESIGQHYRQHYCERSVAAIIAGDLNTIGKSWVRLSPFHLDDHYRFQCGRDEAQTLAALLAQPTHSLSGTSYFFS